MADKKISELTELTAPDGAEELVVNDSGTSKKITIDNLIADNGLSGDKIDGGTISNFTSTGIDDNATSTAITIDASENVGVGTTTPTTSLNVKKIVGDNTETVVRVSANYENVTADKGIGSYQFSAHDQDYLSGAEQVAGEIIVKAGGVWNTAADVDAYMAFKVIDGGTETERMRIDSAGDVTVKTGNLVIGTSGKGIDFSANGNTAGMTSEVLDDYEEGTWTPVFQPTTGAFDTLTMDTIASTYTKVGNLVTIGAYIRTDAVVLGTASGSLLLGGLPFTVSGYGNAMAVGHLGAWGGAAPSFGYGQTATSYINLRYTTSLSPTGSSAVPVSSLGTGANNNQFVVLLSYRT